MRKPPAVIVRGFFMCITPELCVTLRKLHSSTQTMKIGFDAKRAVNNKTGLGNYSRLVVDVLSEYYPENEYVLYAPKLRYNNRLEPLLSRKNINLAGPQRGIDRMLSGLWRVGSGIVRDYSRDGIDIFHGLSNELPLSHNTVPTVVTIHDLIFLYYPHCYKPADRLIYDYKFRRACENSDRIIAVSQCTKRDIVRSYGISADKIDVVYQGCDDGFRVERSQKELASVREKYNLPEGQFMLYVGTVEERKNVLLAVKALRVMGNMALPLVIVGRETGYAQKVKEYVAKYNLGSNVLFRQIHFNDLSAVYQSAAVFVYPSRYEGFGIPVLEALCCGVPVVAATGSCLEEAGGEGSRYVDPGDEAGMATAIGEILSDDRLRKSMIEQGYSHANRFTRESIAKNTMDVYKKVLGKQA